MDAHLSPGSVLAGKYRIERQLGKGGMGAVYLATHLGTTRTVALKVIVPHLAGNREFFVRFQREAEAAGRLRHPNVVNVTDFGVARHGDGELAYLVMEYLDGRTLADHLREHRRPPAPLVMDVVDQVALALDAAHGLGIVHRDLKPDNIWLESNRRGAYNVKVLDFGIAKVADSQAPDVDAPRAAAPAVPAGVPAAEAATVALAPAERETAVIAGTSIQSLTRDYATVAGALVGTPAYMSPEQCQGAAVDARSDVYSLAVITYQMLSGELPFQAETLAATLQMQIAELPPPLEVKSPSVPKSLAAVVRAGLAKRPEDRPRTAGIFAAQLRVGAEGEGRLLRRSKDLAATQTQRFMWLLIAAVLPLIPLLLAMRSVLELAGAANWPPQVTVLAAVAFSAFLALAAGQWYEAICALVLSSIVRTRRYDFSWLELAKEARGIAGAFVVTKLVSLTRLTPGAAMAGALWPVVCALEGRRGSEALRRSAELAAVVPPLARGIALRLISPALTVGLIFPAMFSLTNPAVLREYARQMSGGGALSSFMVLYPLLMSAIYTSYGPLGTLVYWAARECRGEAPVPELPDSGRATGNLRQQSLLGAAGWWLLPVALAAVLAYGLTRISDRGSATLLEAAAEGRVAAAERLLAGGVNPNASDPGGWTPLLHAVDEGYPDLARRLLERGADVNAATVRGSGTLKLAVQRGDAALLRDLLARGARTGLPDSDGRTPLMHAAMRGRADLVELLLAAGADPGVQDKQGKTARAYAAEEGHAALAARLER